MCAYTSFLNFSNTIHHGQPICTSILTENNNEKNNNLYQEYEKLAKAEKNVLFGGRLGQYKYYDMDKVISAALDMCSEEL